MPTKLLYISRQSSSCFSCWDFVFVAFLCFSRAVLFSYVSLVYIDRVHLSSLKMNCRLKKKKKKFDVNVVPTLTRSIHACFSWLEPVRTSCDSCVRGTRGGYCGVALLNCLSSHGLCIPLDFISPSPVDFWMFIF